MSNLSFVVVTLITIVIGVSTPARTQVPVDFSGRWRLTVLAGTADVPTDLLFTATTTPLFTIERHFPNGVQNAIYSTSASRRVGNEARWMGQTLVLLHLGNGGQGAAPATPDREEAWSLDAQGRLQIDITNRWPPAQPTRTRLVYERLPTPAIRFGENLLDNGTADQGGAHWAPALDAKVEPCDGNPCFVVRNKGSFQQTVILPNEAMGRYVVMIGSAASERVDADGGITGLPSLYGMAAIPDGSRFVAYYQGENLLARPPEPNSWVTVSGVFLVPLGTGRLSFQLNQAERRDSPQTGSAARFDNLGCYLFATQPEARAFVASWRGR